MSEQSMASPYAAQVLVEYKEISGFPGYRVGSDGTVWSFTKRHGWRKLKPSPVGGRGRKKLHQNAAVASSLRRAMEHIAEDTAEKTR